MRNQPPSKGDAKPGDANAAPTAKSAPTPRRKALARLTAAVIVLGLAFAAYEWLVGSHYETTDNAYVQGNVIQITPQAGGTVQAIHADDTDFVRKGQVLIKLDPADARIALQEAEANLARTLRDVRILYANNGSLQAQIALREAEVERAQSELARAQEDLRRRQALSRNGAVSGEEMNHAKVQTQAARSALLAAQASLRTAREQLVSNQSLTQGVDIEEHPSVLVAASKVREAYLASRRTDLLAPVDGYVARRTVQLGQRVPAGTALMAVVPLDTVWVDANFKENQLRNLRLGQPVTLTADLYGGKVRYHGTVSGLGVGTGAAFALLPAQNATGNWIKVVQRVPVRIALDSRELKDKPLRIGLSMDVEVDIQNQDGSILPTAPRPEPFAQTDVYDEQTAGADAEIARIIAANLGRPPAAYDRPKPLASSSAPRPLNNVH
ncbi:MAG: efflux RND transporter periplasmic adaptor subunit [Candidimonas sp.]